MVSYRYAGLFLTLLALCKAASALTSGHARRIAFRSRHALPHPTWGLTRNAGSFRLHSQGKQDGILLYLFQHLGITNKYFVEFGFNSPTYEGGTGANTYILWKHFGWRGLLLDGANENPAINLRKEFITPDNIVSLFDKYRIPIEPDYVSIDIDSTDLWLFRALILGGYRPRVVSVEYNINMPIDAVLVQALDAGNEFDYAFGASLRAVATAAEELGYVVVHVVKGLDVMLVRADLMRGVDVHPLEEWEACCTNQTLHAIPSPQRVAGLMDYNVFQQTGDEDTAKAAAGQYLAERPYLMTRPSIPFEVDL